MIDSWKDVKNSLTYGFCCCDETPWSETSWGRRGLFGLHMHVVVHYWRMLGQGRNLEVRRWCRVPGGVLLTDLLSQLYYRIQDPKPESVPNQGRLILLTSITKQENSLSFTHSLILWRHFFKWGSLLSENSSLHQVDIKRPAQLTPCQPDTKILHC